VKRAGSADRSEEERGRRGSRIRRTVYALAAVTLFAGALAGVRTLAPSEELGVLLGPGWAGCPRQVDGPWVLAPPGLFRLIRLPRRAASMDLPLAAELRLRGRDGGLFGFRGRCVIELRPLQWNEAARAVAKDGLRGMVVAAVREAGTALGSALRNEALAPRAAEQFRSDISRELLTRGFELKRLDLEGTDALTVRAGTKVEPADTRLLVIGLDGADWGIIDPLVEKGRMPHLASLIRSGVRSRLLTISPTLSPVVWTSAATGVEPHRHGILDFLVADPHGGEGQPVTSVQRRVPTVWEMLSAAGVPVGVVGWWATWPAGPVRGYLVSDRVAYQLFGIRPDPARGEGKTWPPELYDRIRRHVASPDSIGWDRVRPFLTGRRRQPGDFDPEETKMLEDLRTVLASGQTYEDIAIELQVEKPARFESVYFEGTDTVGHLFMSYRPPRLPRVDEARFESFHDVVDRYYEMIDASLGRLLENRAGWTVMVLSDHGFTIDAARPLSTDSRIGHGPAADWHRRFGILVLSGPHVREGARIAGATIYDIAPTILALFGQPVPHSWPGHALGDALDPEFLDAHPVCYRPDEPERETTSVASSGEVPSIDPDAAELREKLRSLGYVSSTSESSVRVTTQNNTGIALLTQGKPAEAERAFREALTSGPENPVVLVNLGTALRVQDKRDEARGVLERAMRHTATRRAAGQQLAQMKVDTGDLRGAERLLREVVAVEPGAADAVNGLGLVLDKQGRTDEARTLYLQAAELDRDAAEPRTNLGNLARRRGQFGEAESWYRQAIEADPYFMGAYNNLAMIYQDRDDTKKAIGLYAEALERSPDNPVVMNNLASLYFATGQSEQAKKLWEKAAASDPNYPSPLNNLAGLALAQGDAVIARRHLDRALSINPGYGDAHLNLAAIEFQEGNVKSALAHLDRAAKDPNSSAQALLKIGVYRLSLGDTAGAIRALEEGRGSHPRDIGILNALGDAYRRAARPRDALDAWRASLSVNPDQQAVRAALEGIEQQLSSGRGSHDRTNSIK
jgi:tetratricopeptide (TPR) repeat protein/predicted AlkP superfamily phosphohydrolase/phosphomutase